MTTEQLDHLRRIDAHLANLLSTAEKRAEYPHKWEHHGRRVAFWWGDECHGGYWLDGPRLDESTAAFIASCAGNAEAGWRATRSLIDYLLMMHKHGDGYRYVGLTEDLLAAFPNV